MSFSVRILQALIVLAVASVRPLAAQELILAEQQAIQKAVAAADSSIVRIETVGGVDLVGDVLTGTGPTTGVVVREDGYIITSRFNFLSNPSSVLVTLSDERQFAAEIVASDLSRMLTLLKINANGLQPLVAVPKSEFQVGQSALALGRTFDPKFPNISVGIVSALDRVWGRALQTDAKTSPVNYGGPLVDLTGRCLGVIVPLSPQEQGETAGVEWYDSGIGFAVPLTDIEAVLPQLIEGKTLKAGLMGIGFEDRGPISGLAKAIRVRPESPADKAGILVEDVITAINGHPVEKLNDLKHVVGSMYAGDVVALTIHRGKETLQKEMTLIDVLQAFQFPYLGILPENVTGETETPGVRIREVFPGTPAAEAGLQRGELIQKVGENEIRTSEEMRQFMHRIKPEEEVELAVLRDDKPISLKAKLVPFPNDPPAELERPILPQKLGPGIAKTGRFNAQLPDDGLSYWAYVPENYEPNRTWGLLLWLHPPGDSQEAAAIQAWSEFCRERGYLLAGPRAGDVSGWSPEQEPQIKEMIAVLKREYQIDPARIVAMGKEGSGPFASRLAFRQRELIRGLILINAPLRSPPPDSDPDFPLQLVLISATKAEALQKMISATVDGMRKRNFPTWLIEAKPDSETSFPPDVVSQLAVWLDALSRI